MPTFDSYPQGTPCYVELYTPDQEAAKAFYGSLFGWALTDSDLGNGAHYTSATLNDSHVAGLSPQFGEMAGHPAFWSVYLAVDDVDATAAAATDAGGTVEAGPMDVMDLGRMASIQDPTGARVNLWQARTAPGTELANEPGTPIWNELVSPDLATATAFYATILGASWDTVPMEGGEYLMLKVDDRPVAGGLPPMADGVPPHWNVYFNVTDVDETITKAESLGGKLVVPPMDMTDVGRLACVSDPQGGMFWLMAAPAEAA